VSPTAPGAGTARWRRRAAPVAGLLALLVAAAAACERGEPTPRETATPAADAAPAPVRDTALEAALGQVVAGLDGEVGVAVLHLERQVQASVGGERRFPLASVYKLPIAYGVLRAGIDPAEEVTVEPEDRAPGVTPLAPGSAVTVARLVERSLAHSDNTASDVLLRIAGGPERVRQALRGLPAADVRVDRPMSRIFADWRAGDAEALAGDPRDTGTAGGVAALLAAVHRGEGLEPEGRQVLLESLRAADTGPNRIRAGVPAGTPVAHKTGTLGPLTHDAGIVTLPGGGGTVVVAVLIRSAAPLTERERLIAAAARTVWEWFLPARPDPGRDGPPEPAAGAPDPRVPRAR
jgi:beta-lactamase class A